MLLDDASAVERSVDFAMWFSASTLTGAESEEIERQLFHQLLHIGQDDKQRWELRQHEVEAFYGELAMFGIPQGRQKVAGTQTPLASGQK